MNSISKILLILIVSLAINACKSPEQHAQDSLYPWDQVDKDFQVPNSPPKNVEQVYLSLPDHEGQPMTVHAWYYLGKTPATRSVVFMHGNGDNLEKLVHQGQFKVFQDNGLCGKVRTILECT